MTRESEANALRVEWVRLQAEGAALGIETERLAQSNDVEALRAHQVRLQGHQDKLHALTKAMEACHRTHGPIGGLP
jgi:hypothetical protein